MKAIRKHPNSQCEAAHSGFLVIDARQIFGVELAASVMSTIHPSLSHWLSIVAARNGTLSASPLSARTSHKLEKDSFLSTHSSTQASSAISDRKYVLNSERQTAHSIALVARQRVGRRESSEIARHHCTALVCKVIRRNDGDNLNCNRGHCSGA